VETENYLTNSINTCWQENIMRSRIFTESQKQKQISPQDSLFHYREREFYSGEIHRYHVLFKLPQMCHIKNLFKGVPTMAQRLRV